MTYYDTFELSCGCRWRCKGHAAEEEERYVATLASGGGWGIMDTAEIRMLRKTFKTKKRAESHIRRLSGLRRYESRMLGKSTSPS